MNLYTLEAQDRAVLVFAEETEESARTLALEAIAEDLTILECDGQPVWDGESPLVVRAATKEEAEEWEADFAQALEEEEVTEEERQGYALFLIEVEDAEDEEGDEA
ncbi:hypothetical protein IAI18_17945 [Acetobacteraceae bacterium H6797]|nr:hypothetical protein [Acetobacteraceae bacterium H6797]